MLFGWCRFSFICGRTSRLLILCPVLKTKTLVWYKGMLSIGYSSAVLVAFNVSPGLNEVRDAHVMMTNSRARVARRAPRGARREKAHVATCVQTPRIKITQLSIILC